MHACARSHSYTDARTLYLHTLLVMGWYNEKKMTDQYDQNDRREEVGVQFELKEESEGECLTERG